MLKNKTQSKQNILNDIFNIYKKNGFINTLIYQKEGKYKMNDIYKYWPKFEDAIKECNKEKLINMNFEKEKYNYEYDKKPKHSQEIKNKLSQKRKEYLIKNNIKIYDFTKEDIKNKLKEMYDNNMHISFGDFLNYTNYNKKEFLKKYDTFRDLLKEVGIYDEIKKVWDKSKSNFNNKTNKKQEKIIDFDEKYCYEKAREIIKQYNTINKKLFLEKTKISNKKFFEMFRTFMNFIKMANLEEEYNIIRKNRVVNRTTITKEELTNKVIKYYNDNNKQRFTSTDLLKNTDITRCQIRNNFGTFSQMVEELNLFKGLRVKKTKEDILNHMWKLYNEHGELNTLIQRKDGYISQGLIEKTFGSFTNMLNEMGLKPNYASNISDEELLDELQTLVNKFGTINSIILDNEAKYSRPTYLNRFGNLSGICKKLNIINIASRFSTVSEIGEYCIHLFGQELNEQPEFEKSFDWLRNKETNCKLKLDGYFEKYKLAIEYDGIQHYKFYPQLDKTENDFIKRQERDKLKDNLCKEHNITLIRIRYDEKLSSNLIKQKLKEFNIKY